MRALLAFVALALGFSRASAQTPQPKTATSATPVAAPSPRDTAALPQEIATQRAAGDTHLPNAEQFVFGDHAIGEKTSVTGPIAVAHGNLDVYGTIIGDAITLDGDVRVHRGGRITGDAWAAGGTVLIEGGSIDGAKRAFGSRIAVPARTPSRPLTTLETIKLTIGWFALLMIIGLGVMVFADSNLDGVVLALERGFGKSFWVGLAGQLLVLPGLVVFCVALALTVIGALLIPFAIVAYVIAIAGLITLGFLATARLTGVAFTSDRGTTSPRGVHLRALFMGLFTYLALWLAAAIFTSTPMVGSILRAVAIAVTWVATTIGLGAAITSRAGTVRPGNAKGTAAADELSWQTPTPVTGVAASTRRVASTR
ncbi:MAG TPA: polymer-forming cytoskeletal protein [Gemmatimonadaceae bacterium]|jgi:hypothetical protein